MTETEQEIPLSGGHMTAVVRVGATVRRGTGPWTPAVHALLRHLEKVGFDGAPRGLGTDDDGREVLTYVDGDAGFFAPSDTVPPDLWSDRVLAEAAVLLRRFHDATLGFVLPEGVTWLEPNSPLAQSGPPEVICHNDFAPYNCVFRDGSPVAVIDLDGVGPGPRAWDVAYAAYTFVPLWTDARCRAAGIASPPDRPGRLRLLCDAYGLDDRAGLPALIERRVRAVATIIRAEAEGGDARFGRMVDEGHDRGYDENADYLVEHRAELDAALA